LQDVCRGPVNVAVITLDQRAPTIDLLSPHDQLSDASQKELQTLLATVRGCRECVVDLPCEPRPIVTATVKSPILIIGQAPGKRVQQSGIPWDDPSGARLREWLGVNAETFYDESLFAIVPMGFCYPGSGTSGDKPPRPECAPLWHPKLLAMLTSVRLTLLIGDYAQRRYLNDKSKTLTQTVTDWKRYRPKYLPLPHPSPRNNIWISKNAWFVNDVLPYLKRRVKLILKNNAG
jgi:uracil-DNA glycosylase